MKPKLIVRPRRNAKELRRRLAEINLELVQNHPPDRVAKIRALAADFTAATTTKH